MWQVEVRKAVGNAWFTFRWIEHGMTGNSRCCHWHLRASVSSPTKWGVDLELTLWIPSSFLEEACEWSTGSGERYGGLQSQWVLKVLGHQPGFDIKEENETMIDILKIKESYAFKEIT